MKKWMALIICIAIICIDIPVQAKTVDPEKSSLDLYPSVITEQQKKENKFVKRLSQYDEYENAIGYENEDGTKTVLLYADNVKYKDSNGKIKDKDISIVSAGLTDRLSGYAYKTKANDFEVSFADELTEQKAVKINYKDYEIRMSPKLNTLSASKAGQEETRKISTAVKDSEAELNNVIQYNEVFDEHTHLRYETTYSSVKEDIVLDKYTNNNRFSFILELGELVPAVDNRGILIYDKDEVVMQIPPAYVEDSGGEFDAGRRFTLDNDMEVKKLSDGKYEITIVVDNDYLTDPNTVYPVIIDPSCTINTDKISDAAVYQNEADTPHPTQTVAGVGTDSVLGTGYYYIRFNISALSDVRYDNIMSAYYHCKELTGNTTNSVIEAYLPFNSWSEMSLTWNNKPNWNWEKLSALNVSLIYEDGRFRDEYKFYITQAVMAWLQGVPNYGIVLKERTNSGWKQFGTKENPYDIPKLEVTYVEESEYTEGLGLMNNGLYYIKNKRSNKYLTAASISNGANISQEAFIGDNTQKWSITYQNNGYYKISPRLGSDYAIGVYNGGVQPSGNVNKANIELAPTSNASELQWKIIRNWNGTYRFLSKLSSDSKAIVVKDGLTTDGANIFLYDYSTDYMYNDDWTLEPVNLGSASFLSFTNEGGYGISTTKYVDQAVSLAGQIGFLAGDFRNKNAAFGFNMLQTNSLWYFDGHGEKSRVWFHSVENGLWTDSYITSEYVSETYVQPQYIIKDLSQNKLYSLNLGVFSACHTGETHNLCGLPGITFKRGAHCTISFVDVTATERSDDWLVRFFMALNEGKNIYYAMEAADNYLYSTFGSTSSFGNMNQRHTLGDVSIVFKH